MRLAYVDARPFGFNAVLIQQHSSAAGQLIPLGHVTCSLEGRAPLKGLHSGALEGQNHANVQSTSTRSGPPSDLVVTMGTRRRDRRRDGFYRKGDQLACS